MLKIIRSMLAQISAQLALPIPPNCGGSYLYNSPIMAMSTAKRESNSTTMYQLKGRFDFMK